MKIDGTKLKYLIIIKHYYFLMRYHSIYLQKSQITRLNHVRFNFLIGIKKILTNSSNNSNRKSLLKIVISTKFIFKIEI